MANTGELIGGLIGLGVGVAIVDRILYNRNRKKKKRKYPKWIDREVNF